MFFGSREHLKFLRFKRFCRPSDDRWSVFSVVCLSWCKSKKRNINSNSLPVRILGTVEIWAGEWGFWKMINYKYVAPSHPVIRAAAVIPPVTTSQSRRRRRSPGDAELMAMPLPTATGPARMCIMWKLKSIKSNKMAQKFQNLHYTLQKVQVS